MLQEDRIGGDSLPTSEDIRRTTWTASPKPLPPADFSLVVVIASGRASDFAVLRGTRPTSIGAEYLPGILRTMATISMITSRGHAVTDSDASFVHAGATWTIARLILRGESAAADWAWASGHAGPEETPEVFPSCPALKRGAEMDLAVTLRYVIRLNQLVHIPYQSASMDDAAVLGWRASDIDRIVF